MILILACCDLAVVIVFHPLITFQIISHEVVTSFPEEILEECLSHFWALWLSALLTMTLERYLALVHPFVQERLVTKSRLVAIFVAVQLPFGGILLYLFVNSKDKNIESAKILALIAAASLVIILFNLKIFYTARALQKRGDIPLGDLRDSSWHRNIQTKKSKITFGKISTCLLAVLCLFLCYFPTIVTFGIELTEPEYFSVQTRSIIYLWADTFFTLNSSLICLMFFYKNSALRRHGEKIVAKCRCMKLRIIVLRNREGN